MPPPRGPPIVPSDHMSVRGNHRQHPGSSGIVATIREAKNGVLTWRKAYLQLLIISLLCRLLDCRTTHKTLDHVPRAKKTTKALAHTSLGLRITITAAHHEQPGVGISRHCQKRANTLRRHQRMRMRTTLRATRRIYRGVVAASHPPEKVCITATNIYGFKRTKAPGKKTPRK